MKIVASSGASKSESINALRQFARGESDEVINATIQKAQDYLAEASKIHLELQKDEALGLIDRIELISMHAEDQLLNANN